MAETPPAEEGDNERIDGKRHHKAPAISLLALAAITAFTAVLIVFACTSGPLAEQRADREVEAPPTPPADQLLLPLPDTSAGIHRGIVFLRCVQETGWSGGSATCTDYSRRVSLSSLEDKIDTGFTIYNAPVLQFLNPVLANKLGISLQLVRSPAYPFDYTKFNAAQWREGNSPQSLDWWQRNHPDWIAYTCDKTIAWEYGDVPADATKPAWVPLDVANPDVRRFYWEEYVRPALDHGAPLIFFDNLAIHNTWQRCGHFDRAGQWVSQFTADYNDEAYQAATFSWIEWLYKSIKTYRPNVIVAYNYSPAESNEPPTVRDRVLDSLDMILDEAGFNYWGNFKALDALWLRKKDVIEAAHAKGKAIFFSETSFVTNPADQATRDDKNWGLANYLLIKGKHDFIGWAGISCRDCGSYNFNDYGYYVDFPEYNAPIGRPLAPAYPFQGVWARDYENGLILVNPDSLNGFDLALGGTPYFDLWSRPVGPALRLESQTAIVLLSALPTRR